MKRSFLAATAILSSTILISSQALAAVTVLDATPAANPDGLNAANLVLAQGVCNTAAAAADTDGAGQDTDLYSGEVVEGDATYVSGPTEVGSHTYLANGVGDQTGAGTFTPAHTEIEGNPYRNGGSVNMFGNAIAVGGHYSASTYDFEGEFTTTYAHPYTCDISVAKYHPAVPAGPVEGFYVNCDFGHGQGQDNGGAGVCDETSQPQASCLAHNNTGSSLPFWGTDTEQCKFIKTGDGTPAVAAGHDDPELAGNVAGGSYDQAQQDTLLAHEDAGEGFDTSETLNIGMVVVCISPSKSGTKLPGAWTAKNGYSGGSSVQGQPGCNTGWYNGGATVGVSNLNTGSHNWVTVPIL